MRYWTAFLIALSLSSTALAATEHSAVKLNEGGCWGSCPIYTVEVRDDGLVSYVGRAHVLLPGDHERRIPPREAKALFDAFHAAGFSQLKDEYRTGPTEGTTTTLTLTEQGKSKSVIDYFGVQAGMPEAVVDLQKAMRRYAERWVSGDDEFIAELQREGWDFGSRESADLLARAARLAPERLTLRLIELGAPIDGAENVPFEGATSAIESAAARGHRGVVRALIERGAFEEEPPQLDQEGIKEVVLRAAAGAGDPVLVAEILGHGAEVNGRSLRGESPIERAVRAGHAETVRVLLGAGADPNVTNWLGATLLHAAPNVETVRLLLSAGADPNQVDGGGGTSLHLAYDLQVVRALIEAGADVNKRDSNGAPPLLMGRSEEVTLALMDAGADAKATLPNGETLAWIAGKWGWRRVLARLYGSAPGWGKIITNPEWLERPGPEIIRKHVWRRARDAGVSGRATLSCLVAATGRLEGCSVVSDAPAGYAFGDAALALAKYYRMSSLTKDGASVEGATVRVPIAFPFAN